MSTTGEFFGFRLLNKRLARLTNFFEIEDAKPLREGLRLMQQELDRIQTQLKQAASQSQVSHSNALAVEAAFAELTRPRETLFRFDAPRALLTDAPAAELGRLFGRYVERDFVTKEYQEKMLDRGMRNLLQQFDLADRYRADRVGNDQFHVNFPFVAHQENRARIIKPLHLTHAEPTDAIEHGMQWAGRVSQLRKRGLFTGKILFALQTTTDAEVHAQAHRDVQDMLKEAGANVAQHTEQERILEFARDI